MQENKKSSQVAGTTSEGKEASEITVQISDAILAPLNKSIEIAKEIIELSQEKCWGKEQLFQAIKILQSIKHSN